MARYFIFRAWEGYSEPKWVPWSGPWSCESATENAKNLPPKYPKYDFCVAEVIGEIGDGGLGTPPTIKPDGYLVKVAA